MSGIITVTITQGKNGSEHSELVQFTDALKQSEVSARSVDVKRYFEVATVRGRGCHISGLRRIIKQ